MRIRSASDSPAWSPDFEPPTPLATEDWVLSPLRPELNILDYAAFDGCRARLRDELGWNGWPRDSFTLTENDKDLADHYSEFERRLAYAYSVLSPDERSAIGCVYIEPWSRGAQFHLWMTDSALDEESVVLTRCLQWLHECWPFETVVVPIRTHHTRLLDAAAQLGLTPCDGPEGFESYC